MAKVKIKLRFFIIAGLLLVGLIVLIIILSRTPETVRLTEGTLTYSSTMDTLIVRQESVYKASTWGKIVYQAAEGERVNAGQQVATVYKSDYKDKLLQDLINEQQKIDNYIHTNVLVEVVNPEVEAINANISEITGRMEKVMRKESGEDMLVLEQELMDQMTARQQALRAAVKQPTPEYNDLLANEQSLKDKLEAWKEELVAYETGVISFYFDGLEDFLYPHAMDSFTRDQLSKLLDGKPILSAKDAGAGEPLYRIVNNYKWYCVFMVDGVDSSELELDATYTMTFEGFYDKPYQGKMIFSKNLAPSTMFIMEMTEDIGALLSVRQGTASLEKAYSGIVVPVSAISTNAERIPYITVVSDAGTTLKVMVRVVYSDGENAVIEALDDQVPIAVNQVVQVN